MCVHLVRLMYRKCLVGRIVRPCGKSPPSSLRSDLLWRRDDRHWRLEGTKAIHRPDI